MPSFPTVYCGEPFVPNLELENALRRNINAQDFGFNENSLLASRSTKIAIYNSTDSVFADGSAVTLIEEAFENVVSCELARTAKKPFGIVVGDIDPETVGTCIVSGIMKVRISGSGDFASPDPANPGSLVAGASGVPILYRSKKDEDNNLTAVINLGGGGTGMQAGQFAVIDSSEFDEDGNVKKLQVSCVNGHSPDGSSAGILNGRKVPKKDFVLSSDGEYRIYAVKDEAYITDHEFYSDFFPTLLCAIVTVKKGKIEKIDQQSKTDNPVVPVVESSAGITITGELSHSGFTLRASYKMAARILRNSLVLEMAETSVPDGDNSRLVAWIKKLVVPNNEDPDCGIDFNKSDVEWDASLVTYSLSDNSFRIHYVNPTPQLLSYTLIFPGDNDDA